MLAEAHHFTRPTSGEAATATGPPRVESSDAGVGRAAVRGAIIGYFAVLTIVSGIVLVVGAGLRAALAVGAFAAIWGGPGWGGMAAAQIHADRLADAERSVRPRPS
jgi:hypothetical protein